MKSNIKLISILIILINLVAGIGYSVTKGEASAHVYFDKSNGGSPYRARVRHCGTNVYQVTFKTRAEAQAAAMRELEKYKKTQEYRDRCEASLKKTAGQKQLESKSKSKRQKRDRDPADASKQERQGTLKKPQRAAVKSLPTDPNIKNLNGGETWWATIPGTRIRQGFPTFALAHSWLYSQGAAGAETQDLREQQELEDAKRRAGDAALADDLGDHELFVGMWSDSDAEDDNERQNSELVEAQSDIDGVASGGGYGMGAVELRELRERQELAEAQAAATAAAHAYQAEPDIEGADELAELQAAATAIARIEQLEIALEKAQENDVALLNTRGISYAELVESASKISRAANELATARRRGNDLPGLVLSAPRVASPQRPGTGSRFGCSGAAASGL